MLKTNKVLIISLLIVTQLSLWAQNNTNSPYTRFGYGELANRSMGAGRAMGGVGFGLRSAKQINPLNPAAYSAMDSLTFLFDVGVMGQKSWYSDESGTQSNFNGNIDYIAMQFPVHNRIAVSIGILPYSHVGYKYNDYIYTDGELTGQSVFNGSGGLNDLYAGVSIDIWKNRLAVGANVGYFFGTIEHIGTHFTGANSYYIYNSQKIEVRDIKLDFGLQYTHPLSRRKSFTLGLVYSPGNTLNTTAYDRSQTQESDRANVGIISVLKSDTIKGNGFDIPATYGVGVSYTDLEKLTLTADFLYEKWSDAKYFENEGNFNDRKRVAAGVEYTPNYQHKSFLKRMKYRGGLNYSNSYLRLEDGNGKGYGYDEYGASVGFGLPLVDNRSWLNLSFEYVKVKPGAKWMIDEQYFRFTVNYAFNEFWFFKRKVD